MLLTKHGYIYIKFNKYLLQRIVLYNKNRDIIRLCARLRCMVLGGVLIIINVYVMY